MESIDDDPSSGTGIAWALDQYERVLVGLFWLMIGVGLLRVLARYLPRNIQFPWTSALAANLLVIFVFLGAGLVQVRNRHITITVIRDGIVDRIGGRVGSAYRLAIHVVSLFVVLLVLWPTTTQAIARWDSTLGGGQTLPWMSPGHIYAMLAIGLAVAAIHLLVTIRRLVTGESTT